MSYLIQQMWACLIIAALIGTVIGWWLKRCSYKNSVDEIETSWRSKFEEVEQERDKLQKKLTGLAVVDTAIMEVIPEVLDEPVSHGIEEIEGIGENYAKQLHEMNITSTIDLLEKCREAEGIIEIAEKIGIEDFVIYEWASMCDLMRVAGIDGHISELMVNTDIDSVQALANQKAERLNSKLTKSNQEQNRVASVPSTSALEKMIAQAKTLEVIIEDL